MTAAMIETLINVLLALLAKAITNSDIDAIIAAIQAYLPTLIAAAPAEFAKVQQIVADLTGSDDLTDAQLATLIQVKAALDARTDAAIAAVLGTQGNAA